MKTLMPCENLILLYRFHYRRTTLQETQMNHVSFLLPRPANRHKISVATHIVPMGNSVASRQFILILHQYPCACD